MLSPPWEGDELERPGPGCGEKDAECRRRRLAPGSSSSLGLHTRTAGRLGLFLPGGGISDGVWTAFGTWKVGSQEAVCTVNKTGVGRQGRLTTLPGPPTCAVVLRA